MKELACISTGKYTELPQIMHKFSTGGEKTAESSAFLVRFTQKPQSDMMT
jgi:hypothetical protein